LLRQTRAEQRPRASELFGSHSASVVNLLLASDPDAIERAQRGYLIGGAADLREIRKRWLEARARRAALSP
jgi:hypothetical protein